MTELKTFKDLMAAIGEILPGATFDEDLEGQIVIYTDLHEKADGSLVAHEPVEEDSLERVRELTKNDPYRKV